MTVESRPIVGSGMVARSDIYPNPDQPRKFFSEAEQANLSESIRVHGVLQPLLVRYKPSRLTGARYMIIGGGEGLDAR
ncbi:MAG: hypothetical protein EOO38_23025 [Cytophagaceae bacterium]|nr:MAG: hypothetical protein EOO38_23025 [Cytophagaceae bacterium]